MNDDRDGAQAPTVEVKGSPPPRKEFIARLLDRIRPPRPHEEAEPVVTEEAGGAEAARVIHLERGADLSPDVLDGLARAGADLSRATRVEHYLLAEDVATALTAAEQLDRAGFLTDVRTPALGDERWTVVARRVDATVTPESVAADGRLVAEASARCGAGYDGWDATF